jgi:hypothetical protein
MRAVSASVEGSSVILRLSNGTTIERDFSLVRGPATACIHRARGLDPRVRIAHGALVWPGEIDFELDNIIWGWPRPRGGRPLRRALVGSAGMLIPAPLVREVR